MKIDHLVFLLSTDWFLPYWPEIGILISEPKKVHIQQGCRDIVVKILGDAEDYFHCSHSDERKRETYSGLRALLRRLEAENDFSQTCREWEALSHEELTASFSFSLITKDVVHGLGLERRPNLDASLLEVLRRTWSDRDPEADRYLDLCWKSMTPWDARIRNILGSPTVQSSTLKSVFRHKRFMTFARKLRQHLSQREREGLATWYREARFMNQWRSR